MRTCISGRRRLADLAFTHPSVARLFEGLDGLMPRQPRLLRVLMYHRVDDPSCAAAVSEPDLISATPAVFEREMTLLRERWQPIGPAELMAALDGQPLPPRAVLVTVDDGYRDFATHAWPVLQRLGIPAILFVPTGYVDQPRRLFWWDALHQVLRWSPRQQAVLPGVGQASLATPAQRRCATYRTRMYLTNLPGRAAEQVVDALAQQLGVTPRPFRAVLTWDELRELAAQGLTVAPHGRWHRPLASLSPTDLAEEVWGAQDELRDHLGVCAPLFSYPYGAVDAAALAAVRQAGFAAGFSTRSGIAGLHASERLHLPRINIDHGTLTHFRLDLTRAYARYTHARYRSSHRPRLGQPGNT